MVICGVVIDEKDEKNLVEIGVKDSKQLSPRRREELAQKIDKMARLIIVMRVQPCKIDSYRRNGVNLNRLEEMKMAEIIDMCGAKKVYIDALGVNMEKFKQEIIGYLSNKDVDLVAENFADQNYPVVSAASIIAKTNRDEVIKEIERKVGYPIGVGYSHDIRTIKFVEKLMKERKKLPPYVRETWATTETLREKLSLKKIKDFITKKKDPC